jgi:hypothetical protein
VETLIIGARRKPAQPAKPERDARTAERVSAANVSRAVNDAFMVTSRALEANLLKAATYLAMQPSDQLRPRGGRGDSQLPARHDPEPEPETRRAIRCDNAMIVHDGFTPHADGNTLESAT